MEYMCGKGRKKLLRSSNLMVMSRQEGYKDGKGNFIKAAEIFQLAKVA
jgi:hypothetical protein